jgi:transcriptional regulator GlxA family with amidase domain
VRLGVFLTEAFPLLPVSIIIDSFRIANFIEGDDKFSYATISTEGEPVSSSCAFPAPINSGFGDSPAFDVVLVCAGQLRPKRSNAGVASWLRKLNREGVTVGAISSGAFILAETGLLDGRKCAVHWESFESLREQFPNVEVIGDIFCADDKVITCAGGVSTLDLMLHLIGKFRTKQFARRVADALLYPSIRGARAPARVNLQARTGIANQLLLRSIELMESNLEDPIQITDIGNKLETSTRHLERLFLRYFHMSPSRYYMRLRLSEAKRLLTQTDISVIEVALRSGFKNASHFTRRYQEMYETLPSQQRRS